MAVLYITEFASAGQFIGTAVPVGAEPSNKDQTVAISGSSAQSTALVNNTTLVRVHTDAICSIAFGANPTAVATNRRLAANQTEYFQVPQNSALKIAVISNT